MEDERLIAALVESFGRWSRCGRKKKPFVEERERFTMALGGRLVASCGGAGG